MWPRSIRFAGNALLIVALSLAALADRAPADGARVRLYPLRSAPALGAPAGGGSPAAHPRAASLAVALRAALDRLAAARSPAAAPRRARAAARQPEVRIRPRVGTPMLVRGEALRRGGGGAAAPPPASARDFLRANAELLRIDDPEAELVAGRSLVDADGRRHLWFRQTFAGLAVWPAELVVHLDPSGGVELVNGAFVPTPREIGVQPRLPSAAALERARRAVSGAAGAPAVAELIVYAPVDRSPRLAWKVEVNVSLARRWLVIVDATEGSVLDVIDLVVEANVAGAGLDVFGVERPLNVFQQDNTFFLVDTSKPMFDPLSRPPAPETTIGGIIVLDARNQEPDRAGRLDLAQITSNDPRFFGIRDGVSASFGLSETYDYYLERHGRDSLDGDGGTMLGIVRFGRDFQNAFWNGVVMVFGDGLPFAGALDVVAHELTHGVTQFSANLVYQNQSGALNEAFSDIFGEMVEARTNGGPDWLKGGELGDPIQNYADPGAVPIFPGAGRGNPATMSEFLPPDDPFLDNFQGRDNGGVHINSSIVNHAYYLLAEGLDGAIGIADAERIFYRALTTHLVANSQFIDLRFAAIESAAEIFGAGSTQARQTAAAFDAVEIFDDSRPPPPPPFPEVEGQDATLFLFSSKDGGPFLGRREQTLGDGPEGVALSGAQTGLSRPSVSGDGSFAVFVDAANDVCVIATDGSSAEECLGFAGTVSSVAVAPNGARFGFVLLGEDGQPENAITVIEEGEEPRVFALGPPQLDGGGLNNVLFADAMDFSADGRFLVFDALNVVTLTDGSQTAVWSIYGLDLASGATRMLVPPLPGVDIEFPLLAQTSDNFITFETVDEQSGVTTVLAGNLLSGEVSEVDRVMGPAAPCYSGDDGAIVYARRDAATATGFSLVRRALAKDRITPAGEAEPWLQNAVLGVIYRRGEFVGPRVPGPCVGDCSANGVVSTNEIVLGINVALGRLPLGSCRAFDEDRDGAVSIAELLRSVGDVLEGC